MMMKGVSSEILKLPQKGGNPYLTVINESGLYSFILKSRKTEAKEFRNLVSLIIL
jgi:prophage antirepressor-like protein